MLVDVHAHLDSKELFPRIDDILQKCRALGFRSIINNGTDHESNQKTLMLSKKYDLIMPSLGIFPTVAENLSEKEIEQEMSFIKKSKPFALGEVGLDFFWGKKKERQADVFRRIIALAKEIKKPLIVHSRNAEKDVIELLTQEDAPTVVLHCFSGKTALIKKAIEKNFFFSIPPNIVRSDHFKNMARMVPTSLLLTETDSPYLGPRKDEINEPANVALALKEIARIKNLDEREITNIVYMNFQRAFL